MASDRVNLAEGSLSADLIAQQNFSVCRRGFDPDEVRTFLAKVAAELLHMHDRQAALETALRDAEYRVAHPILDEETLLTAVGEETSHILRSAHEAAADIRSRAEENASRILKDAHQQADVLRGDAESVLARRTEEAEAIAVRILEATRLEAERLGDQARQQAKAVRSQSEAERKAMIDGASATREKILTNLARKRKVAVVQVEQLLAGRERLLESYQVVRDTLDQVTTELARAETAARAAADAVRLRSLPSEDPDTLELPVAVADSLVPDPGAPEAARTVEPQAVVDAPSSRWPRPEPEEEAIADDVAEAPVSSNGALAPGWAGPVGDPLAALAGPAAGAGAADATVEAVEEVEAPSAGPPAPALEPEFEPEPEPGAGTAHAAPQLESATELGARSEVEEGAKDGTGGGRPAAATSVDSLFARIRADREAAVEKAREVLAEPGPPEVPDGGPSEVVVSAPRAIPVSDGDEALLQRRDDLVGPIEAALTRRLKRGLQDEQNDLLDRLRGLRVRPNVALLLPKRGEHAARFAEASRPYLGQAAAAGAGFVGSLLGEPVTGDEGLEELDVLADNLAGAIVAPLRRRLEEVLAAAGSDDRVALAESVGAAYREWKTQRIELTAADHIASAFAGGAFAATPTGTPLRWLVEDADGPCPDCDDNVLAGDLPKGERFPTGQRHPPAHSGCRCLLVPKA